MYVNQSEYGICSDWCRSQREPPWPVVTFCKLSTITHTQQSRSPPPKARLSGRGLVGWKSVKVFYPLVPPRQTLRHHDCLSARWMLTPQAPLQLGYMCCLSMRLNDSPLQLRLQDERAQKLRGWRRRRENWQGSPSEQKDSACMGFTKDVKEGAHFCSS